MIGIDCAAPYLGRRRYSARQHPDGRKHIGLVEVGTNRRKLLTLAKYNLEVKIGRRLVEGEQADHVDGDRTNDDPSNLQVLTPSANIIKMLQQTGREAQFRTLICPVCDEAFDVRANRVDDKIRKGGTPCCSRSCGVKFGHTKR